MCHRHRRLSLKMINLIRNYFWSRDGTARVCLLSMLDLIYLHHGKHHGIHHHRSIEGNVSLIVHPFPIDVMQPIAPIDDALWPTHSMTLRVRDIFLFLLSTVIFAPLLVDEIMLGNGVVMTPYLQLFRISFGNAVPFFSQEIGEKIEAKKK